MFRILAVLRQGERQRLQFAQVSEWSFLMPAPNGEVMSILTKRIPLGRTN